MQQNYLIEYNKIPFEYWDIKDRLEAVEWSWKAKITQQEWDNNISDWKEHNSEYITEQVLSANIAEVQEHASIICENLYNI